MGQYFSRHYDHIIIATKKRRPDLSVAIRQGLKDVVAQALQHRKCSMLAFQGTADHIHILIELHRNKSLSEIIRDIKSLSTQWILHQEGANGEFSWQSGWAAFSVSHSNLGSVIEFIGKQDDLHQQMSFRDELMSFLTKHEVPFDKRYIF